MLWIIMPTGTTHGWGVCGKYLALEMSQLARVRFITDNIESERENNRVYYERLSEIHTPLEHIGSLLGPRGRYKLREPMLQAIRGADLKPWQIEVRAPRMVGYTFFEKTTLKKDDIAQAMDYFDWVVAGSTWCERILKERGLDNSSTILQGIDTGRFHAGFSEKQRFKDRFVVFSGGKIEFRKGQDLVIRAFKVLQDKYDDVLLVNCWHNAWDSITSTMFLSPHFRFEMPRGDYVSAVNHLLSVNGIHPEKAVVLPPINNAQIAEVYRDSNCGLFPNRGEGGTNLVLMEYMACGKPVIASFNSGHMDVLSSDHAILLEDQRPLNIAKPDGTLYTTWYESNLDEIIDRLDWAYNNRDEIGGIGLRGAEFMSQLTWEKAAQEFHSLLLNGSTLPPCKPEDTQLSEPAPIGRVPFDRGN
ncbi:MAG: glycosyltransferase family 4 protein [Proteobacteria bacterium]|nr:glycosyltransferase family 4 protein [Pseudomonadota bacterium]